MLALLKLAALPAMALLLYAGYMNLFWAGLEFYDSKPSLTALFGANSL